MRDLAKYFLALVVMGTGFYVAQQHPRPEYHPTSEAMATRLQTAEFPPPDGHKSPAADSTGALPVAALADVDRMPLLGSDRVNAGNKPADMGANFVTRQPTVRADKPVADSTKPEPGRRAVADAAERDANKQASAKPSPKKQEKKKTTRARSAGTGQSTASTDERTYSGKQAAESGRPMWQDAYRDDSASTFESAQNEDAGPPDFAHAYQPYFQLAEDASNRTSAKPTKSKPHVTDSSSQADNQPTASRPPVAAPPRRHRIVEGDTLPRLAEKYLGSRDRYLELYQVNSEVLFDPRLIPIGVEIVIPDRTTVVAQAASSPTTAAAVGKEVVEKDDASKYNYLWDESVPLPAMSQN